MDKEIQNTAYVKFKKLNILNLSSYSQTLELTSDSMY